MEHESKARSMLLAELTELRERVRRLEADKVSRHPADMQDDSRPRFEYLLAVCPAIIYTKQASGDYR